LAPIHPSALWLALSCAGLLSGCAPRAYAPLELATDATSEYAARSPSSPALAAFVASSGYERGWPPQEWNLTELTLVALYFSPEIRVARAQADVARSEIAPAADVAPLGVAPHLERHSREAAGDGPWSLGIALDLPWVSRARRAARTQRAVALSEAAELEVARAVWRARAQSRDRLVDLVDSRERLGVLEAALQARRDLRGLVARRVEAGMMSALELSREDAALAEVESASVTERARLREMQVAAARAIGIPPETFERMTIAADALSGRVEETRSAAALREAALRNRLDVYQRLRLFAAADAEVKIAVASQYPELTVSPGYFWDQGDSVWSLAAAIAVPPATRARAAIRQAEARRELAAQRFLEVQLQVIGETQQAAARVASAQSLSQTAARQSEAARAQLARMQSLFDRGGADRLQLTAARVAAATAADGERQARFATLRALAELEDALEEPILDGGAGLRALLGAGVNR
jgi:outer membrane protein TolC